MTIKEINTLKPDLVYTTNPAISFDGKSFCLTGMFDGHRRTVLERNVESNGGTFTPGVSEETDYLVIGSKGTRCCSFACCARVVEKAVDLKKHGASLQFIKESDFLDVLIK
jgi:NAD-dependent DNA ligase